MVVLSRSSRWLRGRTGSRSGQPGQALVLFALSAIAIVAIVGLAVDGGRGYVDRRALQAGADTASEAAAQLLAYNVHSQATLLWTDAGVKAAVQNQVNNSLSLGSGLSPFPGSAAACDATTATAPTNLMATCAWYADASGNLFLSAGHAVQVGNGTIPKLCTTSGAGCVAGVAVVPYYTHPTAFFQALGVSTATERATATSIYTPIFTQSNANLGHYAIAACLKDRALAPGDQVVIRSNKWSDTYNGCGLQGSVKANDFKGWYHDPLTTTPGTSIPNPPPFGGCTQLNCGISAPGNPPSSFTNGPAKTQFTEFDYFAAKGGNAIGLESNDIAIIHASWLSCHGGQPPCRPMLIPAIDYYNRTSGGDPDIDMHIPYFVAGVPDDDWNSASQDPWTVTIVPNGIVSHRADWTGCTADCPPITPTTAFAISLLH